ncbi:MAG: TetR/AcrR family transcriptional regulator [Phycisphaeraceae bacterium]|nr:TetR/AcrR family transcriptional regulator [Phycisphaeraceae bacterium]
MNTERGTITGTPRTRRKGPGRPAAGESLTPQDVASAALRLIGTEGEGALTMRRLGEVLGVKAMALYNHFPDKEAILDAVASLVFAGMPVPPTKGPWKSRIKSICFAVRELALHQPHVFRVAMTRHIPPEKSLPHIAAALAAFADAGLSPAAQVVAYQTVRLYVRAHCLWEIEELRTNRIGNSADLARATSQFPSVAAAINLIFAPNPDRQFEAGLDLILRGLQASR